MGLQARKIHSILLHLQAVIALDHRGEVPNDPDPHGEAGISGSKLHCRQGGWEGSELGKGLADLRCCRNGPVIGEALITNRCTHKKALNHETEEERVIAKEKL